jgi:hypothetical protein
MTQPTIDPPEKIERLRRLLALSPKLTTAAAMMFDQSGQQHATDVARRDRLAATNKST